MKVRFLLLSLLTSAACASSQGTGPSGPGARDITRYVALYEGPQLVATVAHPSGKRSIGGEWLVLGAELTAADGTGPVLITRDDITLRTPDGMRLTLISQDELRSNFPRIMIPLDRNLASLPMLDRYKPNRQVQCDRWFLVPPPGLQNFDEIPISSSQICSGPLVFRVPGGIQPGRWRVIIELDESRASIPFMLESED